MFGVVAPIISEGAPLRVAHASRVLALASRQCELSGVAA